MKKLTAFLLIYFAIVALYAQNKQEVKNLASFAKVWGFLKYYHSEIAKGNPDWDKELIRMIPIIKVEPNNDAFAKSITAWYNTLPKARLASTITQKENDSIMHVFDEKDIRRFGVPGNLKDELTKLYLYHLPDSNKFITDRYKQIHFDHIIHNEDPFFKPAFPDEEHRLLALFRYWNIINYFYPHKKLNAPHWDNVLERFIPLFINTNNADEYRKAFLMLTAQIKDSHSFFGQEEWDKTYNKMNPPFTIYYIKGKYFIGESRYDSLMKQDDLKVGDEIVTVNNMPTAERANELKPFTTGTNQLSFYRNIANSLFKIDSSRVIPVSLKRQGVTLKKALHLYTWQELSNYSNAHPKKLWENMGNSIWYVKICDIQSRDTLKKLFGDIQQAKTVIWDLRAYPNFKVMQVIGNGLFDHDIISSIYYNGMVLYPGAFLKHTGVAYDKIDDFKLPLYKGKMIVLVNDQTQSLAESVAYELSQRPNTIIMGRQTAGTTGNILFVDYPGGIEASFTGVRSEGLNGSFSEGKGVKIDKEIKLSNNKLIEYPDYILKMAFLEALKHNN
ncbi:MAG TPA: S41 family peptidase [Mucilaginibacter sp.]|jgi:C-terminal processing protease CtpA/Prc